VIVAKGIMIPATYFVHYRNNFQMSLQPKNPPCAWTYWEVSVGCYSGDTYCKDYACCTCTVWRGFLSVAQKDRIESVVKNAKRSGYLPSDFEHVHTLVGGAVVQR